MQTLVPTIHSPGKLDIALVVLRLSVVAEPTAGMLVKAPINCNQVETAVRRCPSQDSALLWEQLQTTADTGTASPLRAVVDRRAREQAAAAEAAHPQLPDPSTMSILPSAEELLKEPDRLPLNRDGVWSTADTELYRTTHFMLYREELLSPLREAVAGFFNSNSGYEPPAGWLTYITKLFGQGRAGPRVVNFFAYPETHAVGFGMSASKQAMIHLRFSTGKKRIDFSTGSHLIYGSLVLLFETDDQTRQPKAESHRSWCGLVELLQYQADSAIYAVVEEFDLKAVLQQQRVGVCMLDNDDWARFSISKRYVMVESPGYFHAVRPVLQWLQDPTKFMQSLPEHASQPLDICQALLLVARLVLVVHG
eukprot:4538249-Amphidinium_carterae.2